MLPERWRGLAAGLAGTLLILGGLELGLRLAGFRHAHHPVSMRYVGSLARLGTEQAAHRKRFRVDYRLDHDLLWAPLPAAGVTNSQGLLGPEWPSGRKQRPRLIMLGDSCTVAGEDPYPTVLAGRLKDWEVLNAGVGSWSSYQGRRLLETRLLSYAPDVVTIYFGWNDHWLSWAAPDKDLSLLLDRQWRVLTFIEKSRLLQGLLRAADALRGGGLPRFSAATPPRVARQDYEANLRAMAASVQASGGRPVFLTAPSALTPEHPTTRMLCEQTHNFFDPARIVVVHESYNEVVRAVCRATGARLVDLSEAFARDPKAATYFTDGIHLSPAGHRRAAALIAEALELKPLP